MRSRSLVPALLRGLPPTFWTLWTGVLVNRLAQFVVPFLGLYLTQRRGLSADLAGVIVSGYGAGMMGGTLLGGALADRIGRRPTMLAGLVFGGLTALALGFARPLWLVALLTFAFGLLGDLYRPAMQAAVADVVRPEDRRRAYGLVYAAVNLGVGIGLSLAGLVAEHSYLALFLADGCTSLLFAAIVFVKVPETAPGRASLERHGGPPHPDPLPPRSGGRGSWSAPFRDGDFVRFLAVNLLVMLVFFQFQIALPLDMAAHGIPPSTYGWLMGLNGLGCVFLQPPILLLVLRRRTGPVFAWSAILTGVGYALHGVGHTVPLYATAIVIWTIGELLASPVQSALVADLAPPDQRGRYQGAFTMTWGLAAFAAPALGGLVLRRAGAGALWAGCLGVGLVAAALHLVIAGPRERRLAALGTTPAPGASSPAA